MTRQAKILSPENILTCINYIKHQQYSHKRKVIFLLSCRAGLRAMEIAQITWSMVTDNKGNVIDSMALTNIICKKGSGRVIPIRHDLKQALIELQQHSQAYNADDTIITSERGDSMNIRSIVKWFKKMYIDLGFQGCTSHSGRRTFITRLSVIINQADGCLRDVQEVAGHGDLKTTQLYMQGNEKAKIKAIALI